MDKYEYNLKLEEIDKLVDQGDFAQAAALADTIDWRRVRNVRTLSLIAEIYETASMLEKSKDLLLRAYRRSPVGRNVLYRLAEITTQLGQYNEALEFYSEYVQAAPHDNNRFILKYQIYKGRGSQLSELIAILEEYLAQEYTEQWAFELAELYQKAGQMQKCIAACDDLVLWFHSGSYVKKALELKKRYAALTPRQQKIYETCVQEQAQEDYLDEPEDEGTVLQTPQQPAVQDSAETILAQTERAIAEEIAAQKARKEQENAAKEEEQKAAAEPLAMDELQVELAKSVRQVVSGVVRKSELNEEDVPAAVEERLTLAQTIRTHREPEAKVPKLSIDDILLSMGESGRAKAEAARAKENVQKEETESKQEAAVEAVREPITETDGEPEAESMAETDRVPKPEVITETARAAKSESMAETAREPKPEVITEADREPKPEAITKTDKEPWPESVADIREPVAEPAREKKTITAAAARELTKAQLEALRYSSNPERFLNSRSTLPSYNDEPVNDRTTEREELLEAARKELMETKTLRIPTEEVAKAYAGESSQRSVVGGQEKENDQQPVVSGRKSEEWPVADGKKSEQSLPEEVIEEDYDDYEDVLTLEPRLQPLFPGFLDVEGLEDQIANAILQALSKGVDRTSRSGNLLMFGAHGAGKTTLSTAIAKAVAQERGQQATKIAKIYGADLNRKDIAATVAKIAGGVLIVEEAGDLEDKTVDQLTTAMEFRTDGLIVILEDEQKYLHKLLMNHPRFTMKFTAQIYLPDYTQEELFGFAQLHAREQDYSISEEGFAVLGEKIAAAANSESPLTIADVIVLTDEAIERSNRFLRKMTMGKKRYDENDYVLLFAKDFK